MKNNWKQTAMLGAAIYSALGANAHAQMTGVSNPDQVIEATPSAAPTTPLRAKPSAYGAPLATTPSASSSFPASAPTADASAYGPYTPYKPAGTPAAYASVSSASMPMRDTEMGRDYTTPNADANIISRLEGPSNELPQGTLIKIRLHQTLSTIATQPGTNFDGTLTEAVERDGKVLLPVGTVVSGRVTQVHGGRRISGAASIHLMPTNVVLPDGTRYGMRGVVIDTSLYNLTKVDREGTITRRDHPKETLAVLGGVTGAGAAAGAVFGGVPGALIGAGVGAGVSTAWWLKQDRQTELPAETKIVFSLTSPMKFEM